MKKTKRKHLFRSIKKSGVSFFAVAFIACVSIAIFHGFQSSSMAILKCVDNYFNENNLESFEISCANGITEADLAAIAGWESVTAVEGGYTTSVRVKLSGEKSSVQVRSLLDTVNQPKVLEGTLPSAPDEVAVEERMATRRGVKVGDVLTLEHDGELLHDTFTVTAIINEPAFCCANVRDARGKATVGLGSNDFYVEVPKAAFDAAYYSGCYTAAYVDSAALDGIFYFSDEYADAESEYLARLEASAAERAASRYEELRTEAEAKLDDARAGLADAKKQIADAEAGLSDGKQELADGEKELASQKNALAQAELLMPAEQVEGIRVQVELAERELETARAALAEGEAELERAKADYAEGEAALVEAEAEVADLRKEDWIFLGRDSVGDIRGVQTSVDLLTGLSYAMSVVFLLVSVVVCYAAATRMIDEQRVMIGAQKALGATPREIMTHYMTYHLICAILGILLGWILGIVVVENLVLSIYKNEFLFGSIPMTFTWDSALLAGGICLAIFVVATYVTCSKLVKEPAIDLLRGEVPTNGRHYFFEKFGLYKKLSLYSRTMIRNVLSDKGRMLTTIMGVVGCTSLLVSCLMLKTGMANASVRQFENYFLYDHRLVVDTTAGSADEFRAVLDDMGVDYTPVHDKLENVRPVGGAWENAHVVAVSDPAELERFMVLESVPDGNIRTLPESGMLVSRRLAEKLELEAGSTLELMDENGQPRTVTVAGVMEHYLDYHLLVSSDTYYEEVMGKETDDCVFLLKLNGAPDALRERVGELPGFLSLADNSAFALNADMMDAVIAICTILAAAMALLVLLNQTSMYINRKARELAVMRINGYTTGQTKAYIYKDNIVLTLIGMLLGCAFGLALGYLDVRIIEVGANRFIRDPSGSACLIACAICAVFAVCVNLLALRRIDKLSLTNVNSN